MQISRLLTDHSIHVGMVNALFLLGALVCIARFPGEVLALKLLNREDRPEEVAGILSRLPLAVCV